MIWLTPFGLNRYIAMAHCISYPFGKPLHVHTSKPLTLSALALFALLTLAGCDSVEERAEAHFQSGLALIEAGDYDRALVELRNVFQLDGMSWPGSISTIPATGRRPMASTCGSSNSTRTIWRGGSRCRRSPSSPPTGTRSSVTEPRPRSWPRRIRASRPSAWPGPIARPRSTTTCPPSGNRPASPAACSRPGPTTSFCGTS